MTTTIKGCWIGCGNINSIIGGFLLIILGILTIIGQAYNALGAIVGGMSFINFAQKYWVTGMIMIILGMLVLILTWEWLQFKLRTGGIDNWILLGILLIVLGVCAGGAGGLFVLSGGIFYLIGGIKQG